MATARLDWAGYKFAVQYDGTGEITEYPNYDLAVEACRHWREEHGRSVQLKMRAIYLTPWTDAKEPSNASDDKR